MTPTPQDSGVTAQDATWIGVLLTVCLFGAKRWAATINPWRLAQTLAVSLNEPLMRKHLDPIHTRLDDGDARMARIEDRVIRLQRVIDYMPGADQAHESVRIEDAAKKRWGNS